MIRLARESPNAAHWPQSQYESLFVAPTGQQRSERLAWVLEEESIAQPSPSRDAPEILAFLVAHRIDTEWQLENIVVAETVRRRGLAIRLLSEFIAHARAENSSAVFLEVRASNQGACALYRKLGFQEVGSRSGYYANPPEDAILCRLSLF
jgi:ribosomal-protein-alanine N-acetyltransferase